MEVFNNFITNHPGATFVIILVFVLGAMVAYYGKFASIIVRWSKSPVKCRDGKIRQPKLTSSETVKCYIPIFQVLVVRQTLYGSTGIFTPMAIISAVFLVLRAINAFLVSVNSMVMFITVIMAYIGLLLLLLLYAIVTAMCARVYGFSMFMTVVSFVVPPVGAWYMSQVIPSKMRAMHKEDIFNEHRDTTVIKHRSN